ncbi:SGNH hydrolase superfamily [Sesbania bispinosa]|nr:SGNH hydrolase superfamily [Sesbania bispinosa]
MVLLWLRISISSDFPASFVFGDSLVDVGNNNHFFTLARADYYPFGIDFGMATGRFTNGRTVVDIIEQQLGLGFSPPYLAPTTTGSVILKGVNYASGGCGILNYTGIIFGGRISFDAQIENFAKTREEIIHMIGVPEAHNLFKKALFTVVIGSNDFIDNYLIPLLSIPERMLRSPESFVASMISRLRVQLTRLFNLGARKIVVANIGPIGCMPYMRDYNPGAGDDCVTFPNELAQLFNTQLKKLVEELRTNLEGSLFVYADIYHIVEDVLMNYNEHGFENPNSACCHLAGRFGGLVPCNPFSRVCEDRSKYFFWDSYHPSEAANVFTAKRLLIASFVFGDSLLDVGNNNYILSLAKANHHPFGIDFGMPTGRFTNGRTVVDIIEQQLGLGFSPPYLAPTTTGSAVLKGVNYASGAAGILNYTGEIFGGRINFDAQIDNFANTREEIMHIIGVPAALNLFKKALFTVELGSNDFLDNYLTPVFSIPERVLRSPESFVAIMISRLRVQLTRLFNLGARKIVVANVGPIGCIPYIRDYSPGAEDDCVTFPNELAQLFNTQLKRLVEELRRNLEGSLFVYADVYHVVEDILMNYNDYGFENPNSACCHLAGRFGGLVPCNGLSKICEDRSKYVFWDTYHTSEAANVIIADRFLNGDANDISPINICQLSRA